MRAVVSSSVTHAAIYNVMNCENSPINQGVISHTVAGEYLSVMYANCEKRLGSCVFARAWVRNSRHNRIRELRSGRGTYKIFGKKLINCFPPTANT
jgi:hypothetical protein